MTTITTYNGITLLLVEVPKEGYDFKIYHEFGHTRILWFEGIGTAYAPNLGVNASYPLDTKWKNVVFDKKLQVEIIGTTSTLTDEQVIPFLQTKTTNDGIVYFNYFKVKDSTPFFSMPICSWESLLEANGIDLTKTYVVLQIKNG